MAMAFNISRQSLVPAFLVLLALAITTVWSLGSSRDVAAQATKAIVTSRTVAADSTQTDAAQAGTTDARHTPDVVHNANSAPDVLFGMPGTWLTKFRESYPGWSAAIAGLMIVFAGMVLGRMAIRYNLHAVKTCIAMSLFGIVACGLPVGDNYLAAFVAAALLTLSIKNYARAFCNGYGFDGIFRAACYQGMLLVLSPSTAPLVLLLPLAVVLFQRTLREALVGVFGLVLPLAVLCYVNWGAGGSFSAPIRYLGDQITAGAFFSLFSQISIPTRIMLGTVVLLDLFAVMLFLSDLYNVSTKPRFILIFNIGVLLLTAAIVASPASSTDAFALLAIPSAMLLPVLFVRIQYWIALTIYLLLLAGAACGILLQ